MNNSEVPGLEKEASNSKSLTKDYDNYDEYIADGHDPYFFQGPKVVGDFYQIINDDDYLSVTGGLYE